MIVIIRNWVSDQSSFYGWECIPFMLIHLFSPWLWVISMADWAIQPCMATCLGDGKLSILTGCTPLKEFTLCHILFMGEGGGVNTFSLDLLTQCNFFFFPKTENLSEFEDVEKIKINRMAQLNTISKEEFQRFFDQ